MQRNYGFARHEVLRKRLGSAQVSVREDILLVRGDRGYNHRQLAGDLGESVDNAFRLGPWLVQPSLNTISRNGTTVQLEPKMMSVLVCLAEHPGEPVSKEQLLQTVWPGTFVGEGVLTRSVFELRRVFEDEAKESRVIQTIAKRGYRLVESVVPVNGNVSISTDIPTSTIDKTSAIGSKRLWYAGLVLGSVVLMCGLLLVLNVGGLRSRWRSAKAPSMRSLAVLPMQNLSGDPGQDYFADAMTEELITELSRISALDVISRTSVMPYKASKKSLPEIARELHADAIVEGSVVRSGDRVRVTAQLIYAAKDANVWAQTYDRDLRDILTLQSTVARAIADEIRVQVTPQETVRLTTARPVNQKALEAYLAGRDHVDQAHALEFRRGKDEQFESEIRKAVESFRMATQEDPGYVPAYLALFDVFASTGMIELPELAPAAREGIKKALELDESLHQAHLDLAFLLMIWDHDYSGAGREYQRALELSPNSADVHDAYANYLEAFGRDTEANAERETAQRLDPTHNHYLNGFPASWSLDQDRQYLDENTSRQLVEVDAGDPVLRAMLGKSFQIRRRYKEAVEQYIKAVDLLGYADQATLLRHSYVKGDYKAGIRNWMKEWEALSGRQRVPVFWPAFMYASLGDKEGAFRWLKKAHQAHSWCMLGLNADAICDPIRGDRRFAEFVRRAGLPEDRGQFAELRESLVPR